MSTRIWQREFDEGWRLAGQFDYPWNPIYKTIVDEWGRACFGDTQILEFVMRTLREHHPLKNDQRSFRALYEFSSPHRGIPFGKVTFHQIIHEILKENNHELFQKFLQYQKALTAPVE
jgi:hypothetical protein